jgi:hypothetical protein
MVRVCSIHGASLSPRQNFLVGGSAFLIDNREVIVKPDFRGLLYLSKIDES